jgi:hypothetical protein
MSFKTGFVGNSTWELQHSYPCARRSPCSAQETVLEQNRGDSNKAELRCCHVTGDTCCLGYCHRLGRELPQHQLFYQTTTQTLIICAFCYVNIRTWLLPRFISRNIFLFLQILWEDTFITEYAIFFGVSPPTWRGNNIKQNELLLYKNEGLPYTIV